MYVAVGRYRILAGTRLAELLLIGLCAGVGFVRRLHAQDIPQTSVVFLVDMSASFAPLTSEDSVALESVAEATVLMTTEEERQWEQPVKFLWAAIGMSSQSLPLPCGPAVQFRARIVPRSRTRELSKPEQLRAWHEACILRLLRGPVPQRATDISGATALAGEVARLVAGLKVLVILSDFREEIPPGRKPPTFHLSSERVVMLYRPDIRDEEYGDEMQARLASWESRLKAAGASSVCRLPIKGVTAESVRACFSS